MSASVLWSGDLLPAMTVWTACFMRRLRSSRGFLEGFTLQRLRPLQVAVVLEQADVAARVAGRQVDRLQSVLVHCDRGAADALRLLADGVTQAAR